jgi:SAM-dependent methyltransferase
MKNILKEKPNQVPISIQQNSVDFIDPSDIRNKKVLDIGCGYGWFELFAISQGAKHITGIDTDLELLATAKKFVKNKHASFLLGNATKLPFKNKTFNTVVAIEVLEHIPKRTELTMFLEINRVLKENGKLYLTTPYKSLTALLFDPAFWLIGHRHYTKKSLISYAVKTHLKPLKISVKGRWWILISSLNMYIAKWLFGRKRFWEDFFMRKGHQEHKKNGFLDIRAQFIKN